MLLTIHHKTHYRYTPEAVRLALRLRLFPSQFNGQALKSWEVAINGRALNAAMVDGYGDRFALWTSTLPLSTVEIVAQGSIMVDDKSGVVEGLARRPPPAVYLRRTPLTAPDAAITALADSLTGANELERMHALTRAINEAIAYTPDATTPTTTAAQAMAEGRGVCQDQTHIFISAARYLGVPARYVVGYMVAGDGEPELSETHAWAEAYVAQLGWVGFDATNAMCPNERYVRLASGFDAHDAAPIRGHVVGETDVALDARVDIAEQQAVQQQQ
ncbi:MAG: transglutaminase domain-containing protein [Pseudomonadota bacterium]